MFNVTYANRTYQVGRGWYKVIILRNQHLEESKEKVPEFIVFVGERKDNPGMSVTNAIEMIAGQIWNQFIQGSFIQGSEVKADDIAWVETYPDNDPPTVDLVTFTHLQDRNSMTFSNPKWERIVSPMPAEWTGGQDGRA